MGPCHCDACQDVSSALRPPAAGDARTTGLRGSWRESSREVAATIAELIHRKRPGAAFLTYISDHTDGIMSESNTAVGRALPLWPYSASDNVNRAREFRAGQDGVQPRHELRRLPVALRDVRRRRSSCGCTRTWRTAGRRRCRAWGRWIRRIGSALIAAGPIFRWHAAHEDLYVGQQNAARVLLLAGGDRLVSRVLPAAERAAHPVRGVGEPGVARTSRGASSTW